MSTLDTFRDHGFLTFSRLKEVLVAQSCMTLCNPVNYTALQAPLSMEFSKNIEMGGHFLLQGIFPTPEIEPGISCIASRFSTV